MRRLAQFEVIDVRGHRVHVLDLAWPELGIALEYDGYESHEGREREDAARDDQAGQEGVGHRASVRSGSAGPSRLLDELTAAFHSRGAALV